MLQKFFSLFFRRRFFWRTVSFDAIAELYVSRLLTIFAQNIVTLFVAVYLYKTGYSLVFIALYYMAMYIFKIPLALIVGKFVAYYGPKRAVLIGNLFRIPSLAAFAFVDSWGLMAVALFGFFQCLAVVFYNIGYSTSFSRVRSEAFAGREIGTMQIIEKIARILSPLVGGAIAAFISPEAAIITACALFCVSSLPLFRSVEPTTLKAKINYLKGFPWRMTMPPLVAQVGAGVDFIVSGLIWTMFLAIVIFSGTGNTLYVAIGGLASFGVLISIISSWTFGKIIDNKKTGMLVVVGAISRIGLHAFRPFTNTPAVAAGVNTVSETTVSAYSMSLMRINFDAADMSGARIVYMTYSEIALNIGAAISCLLWVLVLHMVDIQDSFTWLFWFGAAAMLLILPARRFVSRR